MLTEARSYGVVRKGCEGKMFNISKKVAKYQLFRGFNRFSRKAIGHFFLNTYFFNPWKVLFQAHHSSLFGNCNEILTPSRAVWFVYRQTTYANVHLFTELRTFYGIKIYVIQKKLQPLENEICRYINILKKSLIIR